MIGRKTNFFPDKDEGFFLVGSYVLVPGEHFLLRRPTLSDAPTGIYSEKTTKTAFFATLSEKNEYFICF